MTPWTRSMNDTLEAIHSEWMPMSWAFTGDVSDWLKTVWPRLQIHRNRAMNTPSVADPLGARGTIQIVWSSGDLTVGVVVFGEPSPMLEPGTLQIYMVAQWPDLFRMRNDGTTT